jgi:DNA (cytosine-5)-methyltransferase 1
MSDGHHFSRGMHTDKGMELTILDICTGAGGEALGLETSGFTNIASVENDALACQTLRLNRPSWNVMERDIRELTLPGFLKRAGLSCPFSVKS